MCLWGKGEHKAAYCILVPVLLSLRVAVHGLSKARQLWGLPLVFISLLQWSVEDLAWKGFCASS